MKQPTTPIEIVFLQWMDATGTDGWLEADDVRTDPQYMETCGFLICETKEAVTVTVAHVPDMKSCSKPIGAYMTIPRGCITKMARIPTSEMRRKAKRPTRTQI